MNLSDAAKESGIEEMYIEDNIVAVTVKISNIDPFTERVTIDHNRWHSMVRTLMNNVKKMLSAKGIYPYCINEIGFQIGNTLNQDQNYSLFRDLANEQANRSEASVENEAEALVKLAARPENTELFFKNQYCEPYVAVRVGNDRHLEIIKLQSKKYEGYLIKLFYENSNRRILGKDTVNKALNLLEANTLFDDKIIPLNIRVAWGKSENRAKLGCIYYDMTDHQGRIIEISPSGWKIISGSDEHVPILFKRHNQTSQVEPATAYNFDIIEQFLNLTNIRDENHRHLLKVYIVSLLVPEIDHVILTTYGPKGAAKTFLLWLIKMLVDPSKPVLLTLLRDIPEFIQQVNHNYLAFYDNVKYIPYWLSDEICKIVTGIGHTKRKLFTDDQDIVFEHHHCVAINGIDVALTEPDAMDRSLFIKLEEIDENNVRKKEDLVREFEQIRSRLLGFIFDILVKAMIIKLTLRLSRLSRMADFTEWGEAISRALGYENMSFIQAYRENRNEQNIVTVEENIVGRILVKFYKSFEAKNKENPIFVGSPEELHKELINYAEQNDIPINSRQFPAAANILVKKLNAIKSNLKEAYNIIICISRDKENNSVINISRANDIRDPSKIRVVQNYYELFVCRQQVHDYNNSLVQAPCFMELTSGMSERPAEGQTLNSQSGGSEVPEVNSPTSAAGKDQLSASTVEYFESTDSETTIYWLNEWLRNLDSKDIAIFEVFKDDVLKEIKTANGSTVSVTFIIKSLCKQDEMRRKYIGDKFGWKENDKVKALHIAVIHSQNVEVVRITSELYVKWKMANNHYEVDADNTK